MIYLYRRNKTGICIDRVYGHDGIVELPETLEGLPVTELGAYIFSDHIDRGDLEKCRMSGKFCTEDGLEVQDEEGMPEMSGNAVQELILPSKLRKVGRYAFYNCFHLKKLSFGGDLRDVGVGAMTGCHKIERVTVKTDENGDSCLRDILTELPETLRVDMDKNGEQGRFWFPEFFEEGVENTPARIIENHVHGSGIRYRNSFLHKKLNILEYDKLFPYAEAWEEESIVLKLVLDRILYPMDLTETRKKNTSSISENTESVRSVSLAKKKNTQQCGRSSQRSLRTGQRQKKCSSVHRDQEIPDGSVSSWTRSQAMEGRRERHLNCEQRRKKQIWKFCS